MKWMLTGDKNKIIPPLYFVVFGACWCRAADWAGMGNNDVYKG